MEKFPGILGSKKEKEKNEGQEFEYGKKAGRLLRMMVVGLLVSISPMKEKSAMAAENMKGLDWENGAATMKEMVFSEKNEVGSNFARFKSGGGIWFEEKIGSVSRTSISIKEDIESLNSGLFDKVCRSHTHPNIPDDLKVENGQLEKSSLPPSLSDLLSGMGIEIGSRDGLNRDIQIENAVFDKQGVWYYHPATKDDLSKSSASNEIERNDLVAQNFHSALDNFLGSISEEAKEELFNKVVSEDDYMKMISESEKKELSNNEYKAFQTNVIKKKATVGTGVDRIVKMNFGLTGFEEEINSICKIVDLVESYSDEINPDLATSYKDLVQETLTEAVNFQKVYDDFVKKSQISELTDEDRQKVEDAYLSLDYMVRFVTYSELKNESACEGAHLE